MISREQKQNKEEDRRRSSGDVGDAGATTPWSWRQVAVERICLWLYQVGWWLALPFVLGRLWWRGRQLPAYRRHIWQRLGYYRDLPRPSAGCWWLHAVSVGENVAAASLVNSWIQRCAAQLASPPTGAQSAVADQNRVPYSIVVSCMTPTGAEQIQRLYGKQVIQVYLPYDLPSMVNRFLDYFRPQCLVLMESEIWPVLICEVQRRRIPIFLVNGRLTYRSFLRFSYIKWLTRLWLQRFTKIMVKSREDLAYFAKLGAHARQLILTGNLKFDLTITPIQQRQAASLRAIWGRRPVFIAASTHDKEEQLVLAAVQQVWQRYPELLLIVAPRHPERFGLVTELFKQQLGATAVLNYSQLAQYADTKNNPVGDVITNVNIDFIGLPRVIVVDVMGRLMPLYGASDLVFVGGSLVPIGGHNLLEAAVWQKPLLSGPYLSNFIETKEKLCHQQGLVIVQNAEELAQQLGALLADPQRAERLGVAAYKVVAQNRGATHRTLEEIDKHMQRS